MEHLYGVIIEENNKNNKLELLEYANDKKLGAISFISLSELFEKIIGNTLHANSGLLLHNLLLLGDALGDILKNISILISNNITLHVLESDFTISTLTCNALQFTQSLRACESSLHQKRLELRRARSKMSGKKVGRKRGVLISSKFDPFRKKIEELYHLGLSMNKIVEHIGVGTQQSLYHYIKSRGIKKA